MIGESAFAAHVVPSIARFFGSGETFGDLIVSVCIEIKNTGLSRIYANGESAFFEIPNVFEGHMNVTPFTIMTHPIVSEVKDFVEKEKATHVWVAFAYY